MHARAGRVAKPAFKPKGFEEIVKYGVYLHNRGEFEEALKFLRQAEEIHPRHEHVLYCLAATAARAGDTAAALKALRTAIQASAGNRALAKGDADFDPIRDEDEFIDLVYAQAELARPRSRVVGPRQAVNGRVLTSRSAWRAHASGRHPGRRTRHAHEERAAPRCCTRRSGVPLLEHVLRSVQALGLDPITVVVGHQAEAVEAAFAGRGLHFVRQEPPLGHGPRAQVAQEQARPIPTARCWW